MRSSRLAEYAVRVHLPVSSVSRVSSACLIVFTLAVAKVKMNWSRRCLPDSSNSPLSWFASTSVQKTPKYMCTPCICMRSRHVKDAIRGRLALHVEVRQHVCPFVFWVSRVSVAVVYEQPHLLLDFRECVRNCALDGSGRSVVLSGWKQSLILQA